MALSEPLLAPNPYNTLVNQGYEPEVIATRWQAGAVHTVVQFTKQMELSACEKVARVFGGLLGACGTCCILPMQVEGYTDYCFRAPIHGQLVETICVPKRAMTRDGENRDFTDMPFDGRDQASVAAYADGDGAEALQDMYTHKFIPLPFIGHISKRSGFIFAPFGRIHDAFYVDVWERDTGISYPPKETKQAINRFAAAYTDDVSERINSTVFMSDHAPPAGTRFRDTFRLHKEIPANGEWHLLDLNTTIIDSDSMCLSGNYRHEDIFANWDALDEPISDGEPSLPPIVVRPAPLE